MVEQESDFYNAPLNPCSLESLPHPIEIGGDRSWPVIMGCYELGEDNVRKGHMDLFLVPAPPKKLEFGAPLSISMNEQSGILDGKWFPKHTKLKDGEWWFAAARSSGKICLYSFTVNDDGCSVRDQQIAASEALRDPKTGTNPLCLALNWDTSTNDKSKTSIVSSYSNGYVAIHDVFRNDDSVQLVERESWFAHALFGNTPAEVWSTCFAARGQLVMSGGDDAKVKCWDVRANNKQKPINTFTEHFDAGVTVLSPHPRNEHLVAIGSYDETIGIYDVRYNSQKRLFKSEPLGGGLWRLQWHPRDDSRLLVAAMHGGCRIVSLADIQDDESVSRLDVEMEFTKHESMAYGADWLVDGMAGEHAYTEAAASCSFYDRAAYLWRIQ